MLDKNQIEYDEICTVDDDQMPFIIVCLVVAYHMQCYHAFRCRVS